MTRELAFHAQTQHEVGVLGDTFEAFVARHSVGSHWDKHNIELKREHSWRVMHNAASIAEALRLPEGPSALCLAAGLLHDFGRFPQYLHYKTFHDGKSKNHARLGAMHVRREHACQDMPPVARRLVQGAVMLHNRRALPQHISPVLRGLTEVVRDADKIDIIRVMAAHFSTPDNSNPVVTLHVKEDPEQYTPAFLEGILNGDTGDYRAMQWSNDFKILLCGWVNQFAYPHSRTLLAEQGHIFTLLDTLPKDAAMARLRERVHALLNETLPEPAAVGALREWQEQ